MNVDASEWVQQKQKWDAWKHSLGTDAGLKEIREMDKETLAVSLGDDANPFMPLKCVIC